MDKTTMIEYFETELMDLNHSLCTTLFASYNRLYNAEEAAYMKTPEYRKAKNKAYWSRPKAERDREAMDDELAKLDYWVPRKGTNKTHISYSKKVADDSTISYSQAYGFSPSVSSDEFCINAANKIKSVVTNKILLMILDSVKKNELQWNKPEDFENKCMELYPKMDEELLVDFCEQLMKVYEMFKINISSPYRSSPRNIVTNGCNIKAHIIEHNKPTTISVNLCKYKGQASVLGKRVGDTFKLASIPLTYKICEILR